MVEMEKIYTDLMVELQRLRGGVKTFILMDDIGGRALFKTRNALEGVEKAPEIDIILHSPGGQPSDAYRLIRTFRERYETVNVIVPLWAKSAATLFAFGATRLVMQEYGELGPIDAQIRKDDEDKPREAWESALNIQSSLSQIEDRASQNFVTLLTTLQENTNIKIGRKQLAEMLLKYNASLYAPMIDKIETYEIGSMARYLDIGKMYAKRILNQYTEIEPEKLDDFLDFLVYECPDHGYVVDYALLKNYLPNVVHSDEPPFTPEYNLILERLSRLLMARDEETMVGFIEDFTEKETEDDKIKVHKEEQANVDSEEEKAPNSESPGIKPAEDGSSKKSTKRE